MTSHLGCPQRNCCAIYNIDTEEPRFRGRNAARFQFPNNSNGIGCLYAQTQKNMRMLFTVIDRLSKSAVWDTKQHAHKISVNGLPIWDLYPEQHTNTMSVDGLPIWVLFLRFKAQLSLEWRRTTPLVCFQRNFFALYYTTEAKEQ